MLSPGVKIGPGNCVGDASARCDAQDGRFRGSSSQAVWTIAPFDMTSESDMPSPGMDLGLV